MIMFEDGLNAKWALATYHHDFDHWVVSGEFDTRGELEDTIDEMKERGILGEHRRFRRVHIELLEEDED